MSDIITITPEVLQWARQTANISLEEAAAALRRKTISAETIAGWEAGRGGPTYAQLETIGKIYRRPIALFFFPQPPDELDVKSQLRSIAESDIKKIPSGVCFLIREAMVKKINLAELLGNGNGSAKHVLNDISVPGDIRASNTGDIRSLVAKVRDYFGISIETQIKWNNHEQALKKWRAVLEECGLWVFKDSVNNDNYCGFCLHDEKFPIIYLNNHTAKSRQIFTLFHELGHLLKNTGGVYMRQDSVDYLNDTEEVFCNAFAGEFLVPYDNIKQHFSENISYGMLDEFIGDLAKEYKVSRETILRRFLDNKVVSNKMYKEKTDEWKKKRLVEQLTSGKSSGGNPYATQGVYLGRKYMEIVFRQYYQQRINEYELADYLGVSAKYINELEGLTLRGQE